MTVPFAGRALLVTLASASVFACKETPSNSSTSASSDSTFASMQKRGGMAMGVDQYLSSHSFDVTPDGGRITLQDDKGDSLAVSQIRAHLKLIQHAFAAGDFSTPSFVHQRDMPGTTIMSAKREAISYAYADLPRGGEVRITTADAEARKAIADFLGAQRTDHHAGGSTH